MTRAWRRVITSVQTYDTEALARINAELENKEPQEILRWAVSQFPPGLTLACSFGGASGMVLLDMIMKIDPTVEVFYLDTDFLFPETYALRERCEQKYGFKAQAYKSLLTPDQQAEKFGEALWSRDPDACCEVRKVEPNQRALEGKRAWIAGMRRDQSSTRKDIGIVEWDEKFHLYKINPLANWDDKKVWNYILANDVPYNELHDRGYPSIGCTYCTRAVKPGEDPRAGHWAEFDKTECGIQEGSITIIENEHKEETNSAR